MTSCFDLVQLLDLSCILGVETVYLSHILGIETVCSCILGFETVWFLKRCSFVLCRMILGMVFDFLYPWE